MMKTELRFAGNAWFVVSSKTDWSWYQSLIHHTVGK